MTLSQIAAVILVYSLASQAVVDVWLNGSIFSGWRAYFEAYADRHPRLAELVACPLCLSYQAPIWLMLLFWAPAWALIEFGFTSPAAKAVVLALQFVPLTLAIARAGWIAHGLLPQGLQYDRGSHP